MELLLVIEQHKPPRTRFVVRYRGGNRAFNTFAEVKEYLTLVNLFDNCYATDIDPSDPSVRQQ